MAMRRTGSLFGLAPTPVGESTVLEIACGSGGNLISLALLYPSAKFKGIDDSKTSIKEARSRARKMGVRNCTFEEISFPSLEIKGRYDYIMAPGVYSWISKDDRSRVLDQTAVGLATNGLALFSYNTFPGWNVARTVREMMMFHTRHFDEFGTKVNEARKMLNFVLANNEGRDTPYTNALESERNLINNLEDYYFEKEYLSNVNEPVYFSDFVTSANSTGLSYVGDMDLEFMYLGNYNELARSQLGELTTAVQQEQYMDFITNRRIRNTVLAKSGSVNRAIDASRLRHFRFRLKLFPLKPINETSYQAGEVELVSPANNEVAVTVDGRERVAFIDYMVGHHPGALSIEEICEGVAEKLGATVESTRGNLERFLVGAVASGLCIPDLEPDLFVTEPSEIPAVFSFARYQSETQTVINNTRHQAIRISAVDQRLIPLLNGEREMKDLVEKIEENIESGDLSLSIDKLNEGSAAPDPSTFVRALIEERLRFYAINALLVA